MKKNVWKACALAVLAGTCMTSTAYGQAEACADAGTFPVTVGTPFGGNFTGSTNDGPTGCGGTGNLTQWWTFTPPADGRYLISMCSSAQVDTHLGVMLDTDACAGAVTYVACNDDACGFGSQVAVNLLMGVTYRLRTGTFSATITNGGGYTVLITQDSLTPPANDDCSMATMAMVGSQSGSNVGATGTNDNSCGGTVDTNDVYFTFTTGAAGPYRFSVCSGDFDSVMSLHTACPADTANQIASSCVTSGNPPIIGCSNRGSTFLASLGASQQVWIRIAGASDQGTSGTVTQAPPHVGWGSFDLNIEFIVPPANDDCINAEILDVVNGGSVSVDASVASDESFDVTCNSGTIARRAVWYTFTPTTDGTFIFNETSANDTFHALFTGIDCNSLTQIACSDPESSATAVTMGTQYWLLVGMWSSTTNPTVPYTFNYSFPTPPANDDCATAEEVTSFPSTFTVANAAANNSGLLGGCERFGDVWYELVAPGNGAFTLGETGAQTAAFGVYDANPCGDGAPFLLCNTTQTGLGVFPVFSGQSYWVRVGTAASTTSRTTPLALNFEFTAAPINDVCDDAAVLDLNSGGSITVDARAAINDDDIDCNGVTVEAVAGVWYTFTTTDGGVLNINETSTATVATQLYTGTCGSLVTEVGSCSTTQNRNFTLAANTTYFMIMSMSAGTRPGVPYAFSFAFTPATGACCNAAVCSVATESSCVSGGGTYLGDGFACAASSGQNNTSMPIPDFAVTYAPITSDIVVSGLGGMVSTLAVNVDIAHIFVGDLRVELVGPDATTTYLFGDIASTTCPADGAIGDGDDVDGVYSFVDTAADSLRTFVLANPSPIAPGSFRAAGCDGVPVDLNTIFGSTPADGTWSLRVGDRDEAITGTLRGWSIVINGGVPVCMGGPAPCPGDYNDDGFVDLLDLLAFNGEWSGNLGTMVPMGTLGDYDGSGTVDLLDLLAFNGDWSSNLGTPCP